MRPLVLTVVVFGLAIACLAPLRVGQSAPPLPLAPVEGVLLLRNGEVLEGQITHAGDYYYLSRPRGDLRLKTAEVELVAADLNEVYQEKRRQIEPGHTLAHLDLAEWCVQQKLLEQAADELAEAVRVDPRHPRLSLVERRLELARRGEPPAAVSKKAAPGPSNEDLDRLVRGMPGRAVETFTSTVQPLLVNNCTSSGCHNTHSPGKLRLWRLPQSGPPSRRLTQRNLHAVWQVIDPANPSASPLLTMPIAPHGTAKDPIFSSHDVDQYRQLAAWVQSLAASGKPTQPPTVAKQVDPLLQTMPRRGGKSRPASRKPPAPADSDNKQDATEPEPPDAETASDDIEANEAEHSSPRRPREENYEPVDPFDPEIFNRRFFAD